MVKYFEISVLVIVLQWGLFFFFLQVMEYNFNR